MAGKGGARENSGRKPKVDEEKVNTLFITALKRLYKKEDDDEAKIEFIKKLSESQRGELFIAEHIFGKPKERHDLTSGDLPIQNFSLNDLTNEELFVLAKIHERKRTDSNGEPN